MSTLKQLGLTLIIVLHLYAVGYLLLVSVPMAIGQGTTQIGIGLAFTTLFFTAIATAIVFSPGREDERIEMREMHTADLMYISTNPSNLPWVKRMAREVLAERKEEL